MYEDGIGLLGRVSISAAKLGGVTPWRSLLRSSKCSKQGLAGRPNPFSAGSAGGDLFGK